MNIFEQIRHNIDKVLDNIDNTIIEAVIDEKESIIDLNVDQIEHGINSDGEILGEYASDEYASLKKSMGSKAPSGIVDLKLTGEFLEGIYMGRKGNTGIIDSRDEKTDKLERKYDNIFGIAPGNIDELGEQVNDNILNKIIDGITDIK